MKFDNNTITILKNFASINPSMLFKPGKILATVSPSKNILAKAKIEQEIEKEFAIYDLSRFLATLSLFDDPEVEIEDKFMKIKKGKRKINYFFADPSFIVKPPEKTLELPEGEIQFKITESQLQEIMKVLAVLSLPEISVVGEDGKIYVRSVDNKNPNSDIYNLEVGETNNKFNMIFKAESIKVIPADYDVEILSKGISKWSSPSVEYYITVESDSKYEG